MLQIVEYQDLKAGDLMQLVGGNSEVLEVAVGKARVAVRFRWPNGMVKVEMHPLDHEVAVERATAEVPDDAAELTDEEMDLLDAADRDREASEQSEPVQTGADEIVYADERDNT